MHVRRRSAVRPLATRRPRPFEHAPLARTLASPARAQRHITTPKEAFGASFVLILGLQSSGAAMYTRLAVEGKGGATMRSGGSYDGWWNGGIRNTATFHNTIAMRTEMIGGPTPQRVPLLLQRQIPSGDLALPVAPQEWHVRQSIEYSTSLDRAVLDDASRMRESLLYNITSVREAR